MTSQNIAFSEQRQDQFRIHLGDFWSTIIWCRWAKSIYSPPPPSKHRNGILRFILPRKSRYFSRRQYIIEITDTWRAKAQLQHCEQWVGAQWPILLGGRGIGKICDSVWCYCLSAPRVINHHSNNLCDLLQQKTFWWSFFFSCVFPLLSWKEQSLDEDWALFKHCRKTNQ